MCLDGSFFFLYPASWFGGFMSVVCATLTGSWGTPVTYQLTALATQPTDTSSCAYLIMTGQDYSAIISQIQTNVSLSDLQAQVAVLTSAVANLGGQGTAIDYAQLAGYWGFAFVTVITFWLVSYLGGKVVKAINSK